MVTLLRTGVGTLATWSGVRDPWQRKHRVSVEPLRELPFRVHPGHLARVAPESPPRSEVGRTSEGILLLLHSRSISITPIVYYYSSTQRDSLTITLIHKEILLLYRKARNTTVIAIMHQVWRAQRA